MSLGLLERAVELNIIGIQTIRNITEVPDINSYRK